MTHVSVLCKLILFILKGLPYSSRRQPLQPPHLFVFLSHSLVERGLGLEIVEKLLSLLRYRAARSPYQGDAK